MRRYADFFEAPDRDLKERAIVRTLLETFGGELSEGAVDVESIRPDPPDCVVVTEGGRRIGVEVTELVDEATVRANQIAPYRLHPWSTPTTLARLQALIDRKERACADVSGFDELWLVIHTDELWLQTYAGDPIWNIVRKHTFESTKAFERHFVLVSYDARVHTYPVVPLTCRGSRAG